MRMIFAGNTFVKFCQGNMDVNLQFPSCQIHINIKQCQDNLELPSVKMIFPEC